MKKYQDGRGQLRRCFPEIEFLTFMLAVRNIGLSRHLATIGLGASLDIRRFGRLSKFKGFDFGQRSIAVSVGFWIFF
ncbi:MAG: hypothetical protein SGI77_02085 [Pirellulaceae bacterium]|nr:hypothetical protein [Pirellulaceae bacterium]